jgi:hypothetical protein
MLPGTGGLWASGGPEDQKILEKFREVKSSCDVNDPE